MNKKYDLRLKGFVGDWNFDADYVDYILEKFSDRAVEVLIDSTGGSVATALSISAAFRNHGDVHVHFVGLNASAATIASLGAKEITMDAQALYLVHRCSAYVFTFANMNAEQIDAKVKELEKQKTNLEKLDISIAAAYAKRCKKTSEELQDLMKQDIWLTAQEALAWGFVDSVTEFEDDQAPVLDSITALAFSEQGIPMPQALKPESTFGKSFLDRLIKAFKPESKNDSSKKITANSTKMDPEKKTTPAAQAAAGEPQKQNEAPKPEASKPEAAQAESHEEIIARKDAEIQALKAKISGMEKKPAEEHKTVVDASAHQHKESDYFAEMKSAVDLYKRIP